MRPQNNMYYSPGTPNGIQLAPGMLGSAAPGSSPQSSSSPTMSGALGPLLASLFGQGKNPANAAMPYLNQIPGTLTPYYSPYIGAGQNALNQLMGQYGGLINNPGAMMNKIGAGFQSSPGYDFQKNQMMEGVNQAAAAGGYVGSPMAQQNMAQTVGGLANQDYWNYMNHGIGMYGMGLNGMSDINHMGYDASSQLAQMLAQNLQNQSNLAYKGQDYDNRQQNSLWDALGQFIGPAASHLIPFLG